jgi:hydrogenase small subunit
MNYWYKAEKENLTLLFLVLEGSVPNEEAIKDTGGYWAGMGSRGAFGQPITTNEWLDRLAPKAAAVVAVSCTEGDGKPKKYPSMFLTT